MNFLIEFIVNLTKLKKIDKTFNINARIGDYLNKKEEEEKLNQVL